VSRFSSPIFDGTVLVTGGAGLIGSALIWELNRRGFDRILVADFLGRDEKWKNLAPLQFYDYIEADRLLTKLETPELDEVSCVFHLGACSDTTERDCRYLIENNYEYTRRLGAWAIRHSKRFVYASSAATYGADGASPSDNVALLDRLAPLNMYGYSKHLFDKFAARSGWLSQMVGLKYFNVFGPNENHKAAMRSVVAKAFDQISATGSMQLFKSDRPEYADGEQRRDFIYVKDAVDATLHLAANPAHGGLYNVGSGAASTWLELIKPIFDAMERPESIHFVDMPSELRGKYQYYTCADITRLRASGWKGIQYPLPVAVQDYVKNYLIPDRHLGQEIQSPESAPLP
jgi:ADP-L-glycero-D-manno-heptose 6-epimerase